MEQLGGANIEGKTVTVTASDSWQLSEFQLRSIF